MKKEHLEFLKKLSLTKSELFKLLNKIKIDQNIDQNININKTWEDQGLTELGLIELLLEIELYKDIIINDFDESNYFDVKCKPIDLLLFETRSERLNIILNS